MWTAVLTVAGPATAAQRGAPRAAMPGPPEIMIDFLGRRRECAGLAASPDEPATRPAPGSWREWLRCDRIPAEEAALRRQFAADAAALAFLNQPPEDFEPEFVQVHSYHGPPRGNVTHIELSGTDHSGRVRRRLVADNQADDGRATSISVSWGTHRARTILIDNRRVPWLDVGSVWVALGIEPNRDQLNLEMRFDFARGWCGDVDRDDRPRLSITFTDVGARAFRQNKTNCMGGYEELQADAAETPVFR
jgi:hypothetical protein